MQVKQTQTPPVGPKVLTLKKSLIFSIAGILVGGFLAVADANAGGSSQPASATKIINSDDIGVISEVLVQIFPYSSRRIIGAPNYSVFGGGGGTFLKLTNGSSFRAFAFSSDSHTAIDYFSDQGISFQNDSGSVLVFTLSRRDSQELSSLSLLNLAPNSPSRIRTYPCSRIGFPQGTTTPNPVPAADYLIFDHWCLSVGRSAATAEVSEDQFGVFSKFPALAPNNYSLRATYQNGSQKEFTFNIPVTTPGID